MAEPSKRTWPWKKKVQDKATLAPDSLESSPRASHHNSKFFDEQDVSKILSDHARVSDEAMTQWQQSESKLKQLSDKLHAAQTELATKDILVKQHAKVAEEAVSGWEKAEAEAGSLKQQLDKIVQQKLATEDRVSHLDGALKECMRQLRHVREEHEQRIHETIVKKAREYDKLRQDMEAKLAEAVLDLESARAELIECRSEALATTVVLEDNMKLFSKVNDSKARFEEDVRVLQLQLESIEKEKSSSEYELQILKKELQIRNEEREYERKVTENACKNQVENGKKIDKLETECHKLRMLMRKKLPGPAALAQMKIEVGSLYSTNLRCDSKRKSSGVGGTLRSLSREASTRLEMPEESPSDAFPERSEPTDEAGVLAARLAEMDDELTMLKEALVRRDQELQASRVMCAKTAGKLSVMQEHWKKCNSRNVDANGYVWKGGLRVGDKAVDSWDEASAMLADLNNVSKSISIRPTMDQLHLMDDFVEMERLAMATGRQLDKEGDCTTKEVSEKPLGASATSFEEKLITKERELGEANRFCKEVSEQLSLAEEKISALQSRNIANEAVLVTLQAKLDCCFDKAGNDGPKDRNITKELEDLVKAQSISLRGAAAAESILYDLGGENGVERRYSSSRSISEMNYEEAEEHTSVWSDLESNSFSVGSDPLLAAVRRVILEVGALAQATCLDKAIAPAFKFGFEGGPVQEVHFYNFLHLKHPDLYNGIQCLIEASHKLLDGKTNVTEFLTRLADVLNYLIFPHSKNVDQVGETLESSTDRPIGQENNEIPCKVGLEKVCLASQTVALEEDSQEQHMGQVKVGSGSVLPTKYVRSSSSDSHEGENSRIRPDVFNANTEDQLETWSISKFELDRDVVLLYKKVAALEGELQGERQRHQDLVQKYLDLQQQIQSQGAGRTDSAGSITRDITYSDTGRFQYQQEYPDLGTGTMHVGKDVQIQSSAVMLAECQRSILDLGKELKYICSPSNRYALNTFLESDTACSVDRVSPNTYRIKSQLQSLGVDSGNDFARRTETNSTRSQFVLDLRNQSIPGIDYVPRNKFVDWRSSLSPATSLISKDVKCDVIQYPVVSSCSPLVSDNMNADNIHSGDENEKQK